MGARLRLATATTIVSMIGSGLYACSSTDGGDIPEPVDLAGRAAIPTGSEAGAPPKTPPAATNTGPAVDATPPIALCALLESKRSNLPTLEPAACKRCAAEKCCGQLTKCYGAAAADAGLDGSNGSKTACQIFGECQNECNGNIICEARCTFTYGESADDDWSAADECITAASPAGCADFCN